MSAFTGKSALITGASAGLGGEFALQLADLGVNRLLLTARRADRLEELKKQVLQKHPTAQVDILTADLSNETAVSKLLEDLDREGFHPDILINNAGFGDIGSFETSDPLKIEAMLAVNITALTRLTRWALPQMLQRKIGWICNVGSTAGMLALPSFAVYAATKAYVNSFTEALRVELYGSGINVTALCPGPVETEFGQAAGRPDSRRQFAPPQFLCVDKADVVRDAIGALSSGQGRIIPGLLVRIPILLAESTPRWFLRFVFNFTSGDFRKERLAKS